MGSLLIFATINWQLIWVIIQVAFGLGMVIFVHELGHFAVAKWCGVKCEKFYLGFDIFGLKFAKFRYGETEYGIGILPLGGYVKMLGQDDNPANMAEEYERAKAEHDENVATGKSDESEPLFDPRSYLAKSVPQRMAIISAGVIMNLIFAVVFASMAYTQGVPYRPCYVRGVLPGEKAWEMGLRTGDEFVEIDEIKNPWYRDLRNRVALSWGDTLHTEISRYGTHEVDKVDIPLDSSRVKQRLLRTIGVNIGDTTKLGKWPQSDGPTLEYTPAAKVADELLADDRVAAVNGTEVNNFGDLIREFTRFVDKPVEVTFEREVKDGDPTSYTVTIGPEPRRELGLRMKWGTISGVQRGSPAAAAGLTVGDEIVSVDGVAVDKIDPLIWPEMLRKAASKGGAKVKLAVRRDDQQREVMVSLRDAMWPELPMPSAIGQPVSAPPLGIVYPVESQIAGVADDEHAGLIGAKVVEAELIPGEGNKEREEQRGSLIVKLDKKPNWPAFVLARLQIALPGTKVKLTFDTESGKEPIELSYTESKEWFLPAERGLALRGEKHIYTSDSLGDAVAMGFRETGMSVLQVYMFLAKLVTGGVSGRAVGGPITIAKAAGSFAMDDNLLIFLTMLSANLAVINFLPIPVLDGGHMVFLIYEGIFRRPASPRVQNVLQAGGLVLLLCLMCFAFALDLGFISRVQ